MQSSSSHSVESYKNPNFVPEISLFGDAMFATNSSHVQLGSTSSNGAILQRNPFKFRSKVISFSTEFEFSTPKGNSFGLDFMLVSHDSVSRIQDGGSFDVLFEKKHLGIGFRFTMGSNESDLGGGVKMGNSVFVNVSNVSNLEFNSGGKLKSWIDYDGGLKKIEVRLSKYGDERPANPILAYSVDLLKLWGNDDVYGGIVLTSSGDSMDSCNVYSWKFNVRRIPRSMHSMPADPIEYENDNAERLRVHKRNVCPLTIVAGMVFLVGCGALLAFVVMFVRSVVEGMLTSTVFPEEYHVKPVDYAKIDVIVDDDVKKAKT
ncbi:hypothetical protein ACFE04_029409 [Oxalis oulophora]